jgi:NADPH:quinone reductase-like Zn-dependent oxidoreductase
MFAVTATAAHPDDPLAGLHLGDHPDPEPPAGWERVHVRAAALNHHDLWTLRGVGIEPDRLPIVLGCDAAGVTDDGREVLVHAVIADPDGTDETLSGDFSILSERYDGTFADQLVPSRGATWCPSRRRSASRRPPASPWPG